MTFLSPSWDKLYLSHWDKYNLSQSACPTGTGCACPSGLSHRPVTCPSGTSQVQAPPFQSQPLTKFRVIACPNWNWERSKETSPCPMGQVISPRWRSFLVPGQPLYPRWKVSQFIFILQPHPNLHPFILRVWFNTCLFVGIPGLFSVSGMFKIFVGKNCRICQLYWYLNQAICSKTRQRDL